jgi:hypothetical protein
MGRRQTHTELTKLNTMALIRKRTIPTYDRRLSAKLVPTFTDTGCHVVSSMDPHGRYLVFLYPEPLLFHSTTVSQGN